MIRVGEYSYRGTPDKLEPSVYREFPFYSNKIRVVFEEIMNNMEACIEYGRKTIAFPD